MEKGITWKTKGGKIEGKGEGNQGKKEKEVQGNQKINFLTNFGVNLFYILKLFKNVLLLL